MTMSDVASILGYGAIGLGFLLAILAYRLLSAGKASERPIYVFEVFCLALVIIGALLQYSSSDARGTAASATAQNQALQADLKAARESLSAAQAGLQSTSENLSAVLARAQTAESRVAAAWQVMNGIAVMVPDSVTKLQQVNGVLTNGGACNGGRSGEPLPHGSEMATLSSAVMNNLAAAKSSIEGIRPAK